MANRAPTAAVGSGPPRRSHGGKRSERIDLLVDAAVQEIRESGYEAFTVRRAAQRAGVAPATAYTYFASKDHLIAEAFWRHAKTVKADPSHRTTPASGMLAVAQQIMSVWESEYALSSAARRAFSAREADVVRIGRQLHEFMKEGLAAAAGVDTDPRIVNVLILVLKGAFQVVCDGEKRFSRAAQDVAAAIELLLD